MSINIMDRYISKKRISLNNFQLVAISAYLIATKYEDTNYPLINDLIYISKNLYTQYGIINGKRNFDRFKF